MKTKLEQLKLQLGAIAKKTNLSKGMWTAIAAIVIMQMYFVRELLAAELLFAAGFAVLFVLGAIFYLVGAIGQRGLDLTEAGARVLAASARRGYEELNRKPFRHQHSESGQ
ncbi:MAG: hypothetical protein WA875_07015 [Candidatus Acidiferrales bacterium]